MYLTELTAITRYLQKNQLKVVTAESCTAGLIASTLAQPPGCGAWLDCAFVTYSEEAKISNLHVDQNIIDEYGLTSVEVACAMSVGAIEASQATLGIATTGVAGPSNGDGEEQVGTICLAWSFKTIDGIKSFSEKQHFPGEREEVRERATEYALKQIAHHHQKI